jgi:hypothetical protein
VRPPAALAHGPIPANGRKERIELKPDTASRVLTGVDAAFLNLERNQIPLSIAMVCVFERTMPFRKFVGDIESKLHLLPRYRQIIMASPFDIGYPSWGDDPSGTFFARAWTRAWTPRVATLNWKPWQAALSVP